jgi:hypothetical protein
VRFCLSDRTFIPKSPDEVDMSEANLKKGAAWVFMFKAKILAKIFGTY